MTEQQSIFRNVKEIIQDLFIESRADELARFTALIQNESDVANKNRGLVDRVESVRLLHSGIVEHVAFYKNGNWPGSVYHFLSNNGSSDIGSIIKAASELQSAEFIARHADKIIEISAKAVADAEA